MIQEKEQYFSKTEKMLQQRALRGQNFVEISQKQKFLNPEQENKAMSKILSLQQELEECIEKIPENIVGSLHNMEEEFVRFFNKKIGEIYQQFESEYNKKNQRDQELLKKEEQLLGQIEWVKDISRTIENENSQLHLQLNGLMQDNFGNKTTVANLQKELKRLKLQIMLKEDQIRELSLRNPLTLNQSKKQQRLLNSINKNSNNKLMNEVLNHHKSRLPKMESLLCSNQRMMSRIEEGKDQKKVDVFYDQIYKNLQCHVEEERALQRDLATKMKDFNFLNKKLSRIFLRVLRDYFDKDNKNSNDDRTFINQLSKTDFGTLDLQEVLAFLFQNPELSFYVNFHCSEKNRGLKEFLLGNN